MTRSRANVIISGIVRNLFVKSIIKSKAKELNIKGWVRNVTESEMEAVMEGEKEDLEEMLSFLKSGPNNIVVYNFNVKWQEPTGEFTEFEIKPVTDFRVSINTTEAKKK